MKNKPFTGISFAVKFGVRAKFFYPCDLAKVFGKVGLHGDAVFFLNFAKLFHKLADFGTAAMNQNNLNADKP